MCAVAEIRTLHPEPNLDLIGELTELLEQAKRGEVQAAAVATINTQGEFMTYWERGNTSILGLVGATEMLKADIVANGMEW